MNIWINIGDEMANVIRGTTPTIIYTFETVDVAHIAKAFLTVKANGSIIIEKDINDAVAGEKTLSFELSQADTLKMLFPECKVMLNWVLDDGTRGAGEEITLHVYDNHINDVI